LPALLTQPFAEVNHPLAPMEWASPDSIERFHEAAMTILEQSGIRFMDAEALDLWDQAGAKVDHANQHVWIDRDLLAETIQTAPHTFTWHARNPDHSLTIGGNHIAFAPCAGMAYVSTLDGQRRPGRLEDFHKVLQIAQSCNAFQFAGGPNIACQDLAPNIRHLHRLEAIYTLTDKAGRDVAHGRVITEDNLELARIVHGDPLPGAVTGGVVNVNSPLIFDDRMLGGLITFARAGQVSIITPFIMAGAMSPITMASALAQQNAEALAGVALTQLVRPGAPVVYGGFTMNVDMRSGSPAFGSPEGAWAAIVGAQLARRYGLPYRSNGSLTNSKYPDAQAAYETQWTLWPAVMSHANMVVQGAGWLDAGLSMSYEKMIIDLEGLAMFQHFLKGFDINDQDLALETIHSVGPGGHHFDTELTQERYKTAFYEPTITDRKNFETWLVEGGSKAEDRAAKILAIIFENYSPPALDEGLRDGIHDFVAERAELRGGQELYNQ
jgi:trimethylamine--corrinoid protein Co-methyltransferase